MQLEEKKQSETKENCINGWREGDKMEWTEIEQLLDGFLRTSKADPGEQTMVFIMMETEKQQLAMCHYLNDNEQATGEEIVAEALKLVRMES